MIYKITNGKVTKHFWISEIVCKDLSPLPQSLAYERHKLMMEEFRIWYNRTINPTSWHRSKEYNKEANGSPTSKHMLGIATDFEYPKEYHNFTEFRKREFIQNVKNKWKEINGKWETTGAFYYYDWGCHLDSRIETKFKWGYIK